MEYVVVTPAKNESRFIENTLRSIAAQRVRPKKWVIVDDGSTDRTPEIVEAFCGKFDFIHLVRHRSTGERRSGGSKVVRAFNVGYEHVRKESFDFVVKLDADLTLPPEYFEEIIRCFETNPKVGLCGGYCVVDVGGRLVPESYSEDHVRGAFKAYRRGCFDAIGGLQAIWSWDGIDEAAVSFHGWELKVLPLAVTHHRPTSGEYNLLRFSFTSGREMYKERIELLSLCIVAAVHVLRKPAVVGSALMILGYCVSWVRREDKVVEKDLAEYIRRDRYTKVLAKCRSLCRSSARTCGE